MYDWAREALGSVERPSPAKAFVRGIAFHWYAGVAGVALFLGCSSYGGFLE